MRDKKDPKHEDGSIIQEIESQLEDILKQKKDDVEKELQENIRREQEEAKKRLATIDEEMAQEKDALVSFQQFFTEYDTGRIELKQKIKTHLDRVVDFQREIGSKTAMTLDELNKVNEVNQQLEVLVRETQEKAESMKADLESRFGIKASVPVEEEASVKSHLESELDRLNKIKELLDSGESLEISAEKEVTKASFARQTAQERAAAAELAQAEEQFESEAADAEQMPEGEQVDVDTETAPVEGEEVPEGETAAAEGVEGEVPEGEQVEGPADGQDQAEGMEIGTVGSDEEVPDRETEIIPFDAEAKEVEGQEGEEAAAEQTEEAVTNEMPTEGETPEEGPTVEFVEEAAEADAAEKTSANDAGIQGLQAEGDDLKLLDTLNQYRETEGTKGEGEVSFFKNEDKQTLDGEYIIAAIGSSVDEGKKLYVKLTETESPKDQFFVKQEIIRHQEAVRKLMLSCLRMCEKNPDFLPEFTQDVLSVDAFKNILEKVSMENWSNQEDFTSFDEFARGIKDEFYAKITPPAEYLQSIISELKIQTG